MLNLFHYLLISLGINILMFIPAFKFKTDKLTDLSYALSFIILVLLVLILAPFSILNLVVALMVVAWGLRLGGFLFIRIRKIKKDKRFDGMRESFFKFLRFWVLQGMSVWIILLAALLFLISPDKNVCWLGFVIWLVGLLVEATADLQKSKFRQLEQNKGKFIQSGLWKYSRHPNYFGEILCWLGIYVFVFPALGLSYKLIGLLSPLYIIILLLLLSCNASFFIPPI